MTKKTSPLGMPPSLSTSLSYMWFLEEVHTEGVLHLVRGSAPGINIQKIYFYTLAGSDDGIIVGHRKLTIATRCNTSGT
jgi:hypothetical protein